jgi:hypothetical protein
MAATQSTTPTMTHARGPLVVGSTLILIGAAALASELWPDVDRYLPLVVGLGLLLGFAITRWYLLLVSGAIVAGIGIGLLVGQLVGGSEADGAGAVLGLGAGFVSIWLVARAMGLRERHPWPLVPGAILLAVGTGLALDAASVEFAPLVGPIVLVAIGVLVVAVGLTRRRGPSPT